ncbi:hypothetical protein I4U23_015489 [Adineta vaga]|nr:hypothetical protein I4U23_015489 [Adineta vaga]
MFANTIYLGLLLLVSSTFADTSVSILDCSSFRSDKEIIQSLSFRVLINPSTSNSPIYNSYAIVNGQGQVIELTLSTIDYIPLSIFCLKNLQSLTVQYSSNITIPEAISRLSGVLKTFNLISVSRALILPTELFKITSLRYLTIIGSGLAVLPDEIGQMRLLSNLTLTSNQLRSLPASLSKIMGLRSLKVDNNELLTSLDGLNGNLQLTELSASNCAIDHLPKNLTNLQMINMDGNQLTTLDGLGSITSFTSRSMIFSKNNITSLPTTINAFLTVENMDLSNNLLTELPMWLYNIQLKNINVRHNSFQEKEKEWIQGMFRLTNTNVHI